MGAKVLYISPHLDDAILSCAGRIQREVAAGDSVTIATVFSEGPGYESRRAEDQRAAELLGASPLWLGALDAPFRSAYYNDFERIVLGRCPSDAQTPKRLQLILQELVDAQAPQRLMLPMAVGTHIDHRLVFEAALGIMGPERWLYEERPYALLEGNTALRLLALTGRTPEAVAPRRFLRALRDAPYVQNHLPPGPMRFRCALKLARQLKAPKAALGLSLSSVIDRFDRQSFERVASAVACYQSQLGPFFGGLEGYRALCADHAQPLQAVYAERYYRLDSWLDSSR